MTRKQPDSPAPLPVQLRVARVAELLYVPVALFAALGTIAGASSGGSSLTEILAVVTILLQVVLAVVLFVKLGQRSRVAWIVAMVLAAYVVLNFSVQAVRFYHAIARGAWLVGIGTVVLAGWAILSQLVVLVACLSLVPRRHELR